MTPTTGSFPSRKEIITQLSLSLWTKLVVPSIGSMVQVGASVNRYLPSDDDDDVSSPMMQWLGKLRFKRSNTSSSQCWSVSVTRSVFLPFVAAEEVEALDHASRMCFPAKSAASCATCNIGSKDDGAASLLLLLLLMFFDDGRGSSILPLGTTYYFPFLRPSDQSTKGPLSICDCPPALVQKISCHRPALFKYRVRIPAGVLLHNWLVRVESQQRPHNIL